MNQRDASLPLPQLEVFVLQHRGQDVDYSWPWPADAGEAGFDAILSGLEGSGAYVASGSLHCSLRRVGAPEQPMWLLVNSNSDLVCTVNGHVLPFGSQLRVDHGDEIELGLTRLVVSLEPSQGLVYPADEVASTGLRRAAELPAFDLKDLVDVDDGLAGSETERYGRNRSDFSDLISLQPEENVSDPDPASAPVVAVAAPNVPAVPVRTPVEDPLQVLHQKYLARLRDPVHSDEQDHWQAMVRGGPARQPDPLQHWMQAAGSNPSLDDLLGQTQSIASVINSLDALGTTDVFAPETFDSVMQLFAPGNVSAPEQESLESLVQHSLPGLTRREHHSMSLDSAMPFTGGAEPSNETPTP